MQKKLAVIIVTYNSEQHIYDCLESVFKYNDIGEELEVIVVDNCSKDFQAMNQTIGEKYGEKVRVVKNDKNGGYGQGNNVGICQSHAPYIMIMNPDTIMIMPLFKEVIGDFEKNDNLAIYGIKQALAHHGSSITIVPFSNAYIETIASVICNKFDWYFKKYMYFLGACFFLNKSLFEKIGMFDENLFMYGEEFDIHERIIRAKYDLKYNQRLRFIHLHNSQIMKDEKKDILTSMIYLYKNLGKDPNILIKRAIQQRNLLIFVNKVRCLSPKQKAIAKNNLPLLRIQRQQLIDKYQNKNNKQ